VYDYDFDPLRHGVQPNATASVLPQRQGSASSDAASSPTDTDSSSTSDFSHALALSYADMSPSMATLAAHYKFAELPAPTFIRPTTVVEFAPRRLAVDSSVDATVLPERQMKPASQPEQMKKTFMSPSERYTAKLKQRMPIPSQTDGSDVWRQDVYCASPSQDSTLVNSSEATSPSTAYGGSSRRPSVGKSVAGSSSRTASMPPVHRTQPDASALAEIYGPGYTLFDPSREAKRAALFPGPSSLPTRSRSSLVYAKREVPLLPAAAQGKLLVPNIKLKRTTSAASVTSVASAATSRSPRALPRRGSAMSDLIIPEHTVPASFRPPVPRKCCAYILLGLYAHVSLQLASRRKTNYTALFLGHISSSALSFRSSTALSKWSRLRSEYLGRFPACSLAPMASITSTRHARPLSVRLPPLLLLLLRP
jgi:hypothetical protein